MSTEPAQLLFPLISSTLPRFVVYKVAVHDFPKQGSNIRYQVAAK